MPDLVHSQNGLLLVDWLFIASPSQTSQHARPCAHLVHSQTVYCLFIRCCCLPSQTSQHARPCAHLVRPPTHTHSPQKRETRHRGTRQLYTVPCARGPSKRPCRTRQLYMSKRPEQEALQVGLLLCALCAPPLACPRSCSPATRSPCALPLYAPQQHEALVRSRSMLPPATRSPCARPCARVQDASVCAPALMLPLPLCSSVRLFSALTCC